MSIPSLLHAARAELRQLAAFNPSDRLWPMPLCAALASGLPLVAGAWSGHIDQALPASLGGLAFLYLPRTPLQHRMVWVMACAFGMVASYVLGLLSHFLAAAMLPALAFIATLVTMVCRVYAVGPPAGLFFIMAAAIGAYTPMAGLQQVPQLAGLFAMGGVLACAIAFFYSLVDLRLRPALPPTPPPPPSFDHVVFASVVIGLSVGVSLAVAQLLQLPRPYWVPVSCLAVIQGASLRAVWNRQLQRILGTGIGMLASWALFTLLPLGPWSLALMMMALTFVIEMMVVRHYGIAVVFITPMTLLLAEAATLGHGNVGALIGARFVDTLLGCLVGLAGGACLHSDRLRNAVRPRPR